VYKFSKWILSIRFYFCFSIEIPTHGIELAKSAKRIAIYTFPFCVSIGSHGYLIPVFNFDVFENQSAK
jgi:hypothetical protein